MKTNFPSITQYPRDFEEIKNTICENIAVLDIATVKTIFTIFINYHIEEKIVDFNLLKRFISEILCCIDNIIFYKFPSNESFSEMKYKSFKDIEHIKTKKALQNYIIKKLESVKHEVSSMKTDINYTRTTKFLCYMFHQYKGSEKLTEIIKGTAHIPQERFRKTFKDLTGMKISTFYKDIHFNKAIELLSTSPMSVDEISHYLGYRRPDLFVDAFKRYFHTTPSDYRRKHHIL